MRSRAKAEPQFEEFRRLFAPEWDRLKARLGCIDRRLADIEARLDDVESAKGDFEELQQRFEFEVAEGRFAGLGLGDLQAHVVRPEEIEGYGEPGGLDGP